VSSDLPALRASDAERDQAVALLREGAAEGRLTLEEFTERMTRAYDARTHGQLDELTRDLPALTTPAAPAVRKPRRWLVALMGHHVQQGRWRVAEQTYAVNVMGNSRIDLREAVLSAPEVEIRLLNAMGNTTILVPEGVDVELDAIALLGHRSDRTHGAGSPGAPVVRVTGLVLMGNLDVASL
jgi:hypothetical protein